uniref:RING-type domain-containing protein n=1 Tax=Panagrolaimus sp. PS1159 TaxID=55785 RepID=A0AC35EVP4_9BILA
MFCNYCIIQIETRPKLLPLKINQSVKETLQLLGYEGPEYKQLLKLDEQIYTTEYNFRNQLFIVEGGGEGNEFLVILPVKRDEIITYSKLPFTVCPILSIHDISPEEIYYSNGIYDELSIKMPKTSSKERAEYTRWLHKMLMEKSQRYREFVELKTEEEEIFEERHRFLAVTQLYPQWFGVLERLIVTYPVSARLIARFRFWRCKNSIFVKEEPILNEKCPLCLDDLVLNEEYAIWPCGSSKPHPFHYDCILDLFRTDERCPMCRKPATFQ